MDVEAGTDGTRGMSGMSGGGGYGMATALAQTHQLQAVVGEVAGRQFSPWAVDNHCDGLVAFSSARQVTNTNCRIFS